LTFIPIDPAVLETFSEKALAPDINPKPTVPPAMAESLRKLLLLVDIYFSPEEFDLCFRLDQSGRYFVSRVVETLSHGWSIGWGYAPHPDIVSLQIQV
jgi:hypothetical protein